jgi:hypothetical protein
VAEATTTLTAEPTPGASSTRRAFRATADPGYADMCLRFRVQRRLQEGWRTVTTSTCRATDAAGVAHYRTPRGLAVEGRYRVRPAFAGDRFTAPAHGSWRRFHLG